MRLTWCYLVEYRGMRQPLRLRLRLLTSRLQRSFANSPLGCSPLAGFDPLYTFPNEKEKGLGGVPGVIWWSIGGSNP